jgi:hypothetical protein
VDVYGNAATQPLDQAYWGQHHHQQMRMPQYPLHQPVARRSANRIRQHKSANCFESKAAKECFAVEGGRSSRLSTSLQQQVQAPSDSSLLGLSWSQPHLSQRPFQAQQSRSSQEVGASRIPLMLTAVTCFLI